MLVERVCSEDHFVCYASFFLSFFRYVLLRCAVLPVLLLRSVVDSSIDSVVTFYKKKKKKDAMR